MVKSKLENYKLGEHLFCIGRTRSGKSYLVNQLIKKELKNNFIIFDVKGEDFNELGAFKVGSIKQLIEALKNKKTKILFQDEYLNASYLNSALEIIYKSCKNITVIVDEIHLFITKHKCPDYIKQFVKVGASKGKGFWSIAQRGQDIHNDILTQSTHKLGGYISVEDEKYMTEKFQLSKHNLSFNDLGKYEFWYLRDEAGKKPEKFKI